MNKISIIIPILNEAESIEKLINHLLKNSSEENISEIIIVDGGSSDGSQNIVSKFTNVKLLHSEKGRAIQMNSGARNASSSILYFLHADSFPPKGFDKFIVDEVTKGHLAGCFRMQFESNHWWLSIASWLTQFNWRMCRGGDQSQFITKDLFEDIGGYDERYFIYEDNILINALFARKQFVVINKKLRTSTRSYLKHGIWKLQYHFFIIHLKYWFGSSPIELYSYYKKHIA
ncbi:TIGR04283 family arsenosugar biosynthesis glycosyltransferase [Yeosuana sp.]|uniref:TIGR04283 family arsenosugar biosynthesis glycosyltransferase n=1 Tax=Yeosuana sp. TaxID=2529388 RepID=UPI004054EFC3|tara:strand:- start:2885 stop:3577 length:693 start_codon:yes stop_codon:yes gene_type:complete